ncbi:MAG: insulinase family protein [Alistipes sp.]|nr:insulinase family protein [Alistipes sp.]
MNEIYTTAPQQPPLVTPDSVELPEAGCRTLGNGVRIYTLDSDDFEVVRMTLVVRAGTSMQTKPFSASATANMLSEGSATLSAQQIAERLDYYGSWFDVNIDRDYVYISFCSLTKFFAPTSEVAEQIILYPAFPEREVAAYCAKRRQQLAVERRKVDTIAREAFARAAFGEHHPYGISSDERLYDDLRRDDLVDLYRRLYVAENCFVVCSGRIDDEVLSIVGRIAGSIPSSAVVPQPAFPPCRTLHRLHVEHKPAVQSAIRIGRLLFDRRHEDFVGMQVVATALGGYFGSRLMQNLRARNGYTYGVMAAMVNFDREGYLAIATQVASEHTDDALSEIYAEIERLRTEPMPEQELQLVKNMMIGEMLRILDGPFGIADVTIENILCGMGNDATTRAVERILATTPDDVLRLARMYLDRSDLIETVVG